MKTILLLIGSTLFMTAAWYGHLKHKNIQEVISIGVFIAFCILYLREPIRWNHLVSFALIIGAVGFVFIPGGR